jgi:hypothetical protein
MLNATRTLGDEAKVGGCQLQPFLAVAINFDIVASAKLYCNEISGVEAKIVFKCNACWCSKGDRRKGARKVLDEKQGIAHAGAVRECALA